ncbi:hypothetical protein [Paenibacillus turpanensis]|uniref:hypothetical protein n=1 Tax=Paenibacillus turpanensis TaxID=2689078 RepID=UPI001A9DADA7|nr:hypothetical protein [Paenibacillus turpanensis]
MNEKQMRRWERKRSNGKWSFVILSGMLGWGIPTAILFTIFTFILDHGFQWEQIGSDFWETAVTSLIVFPLGGIGWGLIMWFIMERSYAQANNKMK